MCHTPEHRVLQSISSRSPGKGPHAVSGLLRAAALAALAAGLLVSFLPARPGSVTYVYDGAGRLVQADFGQGKKIKYRLDATGNLLSRKAVYELFCAHVAETDTWWTRVALANPSANPASVRLTAFSDTGAALETVDLTPLPAHGAWTGSVSTLFTPETLAAMPWVLLETTVPLTGVLEFGTRDNQSLAAMPLFTRSGTDLVFPYVAYAGGFYTGITLINPVTAAATVTLVARSEAGAELARTTVTIPALGRYVRLFNDVFPTADPAAVRFIQMTADVPLAGFELFGSFTVPGLAGLSAEIPEPAVPGVPEYCLWYPEIPSPADYYTGVTLSNLGVSPASVAFRLYDAAGATLRDTPWPANLQPLEQVTRNLWDLFEGIPVAGAATMMARSPQPMLGFELYLTKPEYWGQRPYVFDGMPGTAAAGLHLCFPLVKASEGWATRLRLVNRGAAAAAFTATAFDASGGGAWAFDGTVPAGGVTDGTVAAWFPAHAAEVAWVRIDTDHALAGDAFYLSPAADRLGSYPALVLGQ